MRASHVIHTGDCREVLASLPADSVQTCITSPPYWGLRDYGMAGQLGLEQGPDEYVANLVQVFREVRRVLRPDGTIWLNLGDSYAGQAGGGQGPAGQCAGRAVSLAGANKTRRKVGAGLKPKDLVGIPWRVALALQADGWWLRSDIIWSKPTPMPESVNDRPTRAHEYVFLLAKSGTYFYDAAAVKEKASPNSHGGQPIEGGPKQAALRQQVGGRMGLVPEDGKRNRRTVWTVVSQPNPEPHFATMPEALVLPCVLAGSRGGDTVLDPFAGSGTTGLVALKQGRAFVGVELNPEYVAMAERRLAAVDPLLAWAGGQ